MSSAVPSLTDSAQYATTGHLHAHDLMRAMLNYAVRKGKASRNIAAFVSEDLPKAAKPVSVALTRENKSLDFGNSTDPAEERDQKLHWSDVP
jgi:hypothetical protein